MPMLLFQGPHHEDQPSPHTLDSGEIINFVFSRDLINVNNKNYMLTSLKIYIKLFELGLNYIIFLVETCTMKVFIKKKPHYSIKWIQCVNCS